MQSYVNEHMQSKWVLINIIKASNWSMFLSSISPYDCDVEYIPAERKRREDSDRVCLQG